MPITISDPELERRLAELGQKQTVPVKKSSMARAILEEATRDLRRPNAWRRDRRDGDDDDGREAA